MALDTLIDRAFAPAAASVESGAIPGAVLGVVTADPEWKLAPIARERSDRLPHFGVNSESLSRSM